MIVHIFVIALFFTSCISAEPVPETSPEPVVRNARLVFVGDVMSHSPQVAAAKTATGFDYNGVFGRFRPVFESADVVVANLETTLRTKPPYTGYPMFAAPAELAFALREVGVDIVTTANNHICDRGAAGIRSTLAILDSAGLKHTGAFAVEPDSFGDTLALAAPTTFSSPALRFTVDSIDFALLSYTYGTNGMPVPKGFAVNLIDTVQIARDLAAIRRQSPDLTTIDEVIASTEPVDCVIVCFHWGEEYRRRPTKTQRELASWMRAHGADIIIGGHPHVVESFEAHYNADSTLVTGATYYSPGNFVSNQRGRYTDGGMAAEITVTKTDSLPLSYELGYRLFWIHTPIKEGIRHYEILPAAAIDSLPHDSLPAAHTFLSDTRTLLSTADSVFVERKTMWQVRAE